MKRTVFCLLLATACFPEPELGEPLAGSCVAEDSDPATKVSFGQDVRPLFDRGMGQPGCGCHNSATGQGVTLSGFDMTSLAKIRVGGMTTGNEIIVPGDPCRSRLVQKLSSAPPWGARMPLNGPPFFTHEEVQLIADWIAEGAEDN
jgi:hypothetical protein